MKARLKINLTDAILFRDKFGYNKPVSQDYIFYKKGSIVEYEFINNYYMISDAGVKIIIPSIATDFISCSLFDEAFIKLEDERDEKINSILK